MKDSLAIIYGTIAILMMKRNNNKLMLQTAPVALIFPPTIGPFAKADSSPLVYEFSG